MAARTSLLVPSSKPLPAPPVVGGGLVTSNAPPLVLPGEHFAAAFTFFAVGALSLTIIAPELAAGTFVATRVAAVVHLFTLGFISTSIFGALYQFLPVAVGMPIRSQRLAHVTFVVLMLGIVAFVVGLAAEIPRLVPMGGALVATAFALFAANLVATLRSARERSLTYWALAGAALYLVVTLGFGFALALNVATGFATAHRFDLLVSHIHVAVFGWVMLVMVGVGHRLLPMFLLSSHDATEVPAWIAVGALVVGCALVALPLGGVARLAGFGVSAVGVVAFLVQAALFYRHRKKKGDLDPGMRLALAGLFGVGAALLLAPLAVLRGLEDVTMLTTYVFVLVVGGISLFVAGHYFKIVPFLVWYHRFGSKIGKGKLPRVVDLYSSKLATAALAGLALGVATTAAGILAKSVHLTRAGALVLLAGVLIEAREMIRVARVKAT